MTGILIALPARGMAAAALVAALAPAAGAAPIAAAPAAGADMIAAAPAAPAASSDIVVTGSRFGGRSSAASLTPVDRVDRERLSASGATEVQDMLRRTIPGFSMPRPATAGAQDFLQSPTLRGLSTGELLLLVNGKRRHLSPSLNISVQIGRGDVAYDFNAIPALALARAEVLRDGASAQYGSDAIAGVINLVLDDRVGVDGTAGYRETSRGDGGTWSAALGAGFRLGDGGVVRVTGEYDRQAITDRARADTRQQYFGISAAGAPLAPSGNFGSGTGLTAANGTRDPREATVDRTVWVYGQPSYVAKKLFVNARLPLAGEAAELYGFGGYSDLVGDSAQFFRRAGQDQTVRSLFPDGYLPNQRVHMRNWSAAAGVRGTLAGFGYDLSSSLGEGKESFRYTNTNNVSLGGASPTSFRRGAARLRQWTSNLDLTRTLDLGDGAPLKLAAGAEYRVEYFRVFAGEPDSYRNGGVAIIGGPATGLPAPVGAQPGTGIAPADARAARRHSQAAYAEVEKQLFGRLTLDGAVRYEDFSDFGDTLNWKGAARLELARGLALRGSYNTGFRAPTLQQSFTSSTDVSFVAGQPTTIRTISVNSPLAPLVGAAALKPEKARTRSLGLVFTPPASGLTVTADYYNISIDNRIAVSSNFSSPTLTALLAANGTPGVQTVSFLTNAVDTTTQGVDLSASWRHKLADGTLSLTFGGTAAHSRFRRIAGTPAPLAALGIGTVLFDLTQQIRFTTSIPRDKGFVALAWEGKRFGVSLVNTYYGGVSQVAITGRSAAQVAALVPGYDIDVRPANAAGTSFDLIQNFRARVITDLAAHYRVTRAITLTLGADNLFDIMPGRQLASTAASVAAGTNGGDNAGIFPYAYIAPWGVNGATLYGRIRFAL